MNANVGGRNYLKQPKSIEIKIIYYFENLDGRKGLIYRCMKINTLKI